MPSKNRREEKRKEERRAVAAPRLSSLLEIA
jgi:hypothetical protein